MNEDKDIILEVKNLTVEYTSGGEIIHAVNDVSFSLERGKTLGLVGETGAGKTTIAKSIIRVLPTMSATVRSGEILMDGKNILTVSENEMSHIRGNEISMIFQDPMTALNPTMTVGSQVAEVFSIHRKVSADEAENEAIKILEQVNIMEDRYNDFPFQFSGGMRQRAVIAIALACQPQILLADEPTTALDVTIQAQMLELISGLKNIYRTSMILITHDLGVVAENCDSVGVVYAGKIVESGSREDIFLRPSHPYTVGLFQSLPSFSVNSSRLKPIDGLPPNPSNLPEGCAFHPRCPYKTEECTSGTVLNQQLSPGHFCRCIHPQNGGINNA